MLYAEFDSEHDADEWRSHNGGWLFISDSRSFWFGLSFTASMIITHPALHGLSGKLK